MQSEDQDKSSNDVKSYNNENIRCAYPDYDRQPNLGYLDYPRLYELARQLQLLSFRNKRGC